MLPRLVATDLDGTIVRADGTVSDRTISALRGLSSAGIHIVFATGRPPRWLYPVVKATGLNGPAVCSNGAQIYDPATRKILVEEVLDEAQAMEIAKDLRSQFKICDFAVEIGLNFGHEPTFAPQWEAPPGSTIAPIDQLLELPVVKLMAYCPSIAPDKLLREATFIVGDRATVTRSIGISLIEISKRGISKATSLAHLAETLSVRADEVLAFGDQTNDAPMLKWAGRSVAVENAHQDAKSCADEVTLSVEDDGVAITIEEILRYHPGAHKL